MRRTVMLMLVTAIAVDLTYWILWFADRDSIASVRTESYYQFENAFPLADAWLGLACVLALVALGRRSPLALLWLIAAGAAGVYLGSMDLLYDIEHAIFARGSAGMTELAIVVLTWSFASIVLVWSWRNRQQLLGPEPATTVTGARYSAARS